MFRPPTIEATKLIAPQICWPQTYRGVLLGGNNWRPIWFSLVSVDHYNHKTPSKIAMRSLIGLVIVAGIAGCEAADIDGSPPLESAATAGAESPTEQSIEVGTPASSDPVGAIAMTVDPQDENLDDHPDFKDPGGPPNPGQTPDPQMDDNPQNLDDHPEFKDPGPSPWSLQPALLGTKWTLNAPGVNIDDLPWIEFGSKDNQLRGSDGCNSILATYLATETEINVGPIASTKKACPNLQTAASQFAAALQSATNYQIINGNELHLSDGPNTVILHLATN